MWQMEKVAIGLALISTVATVGFIRGYSSLHPRAAQFHEAIVQNRLGFRLLLPDATWEAMTYHPAGITSAQLTEKVHATIRQLVEAGIAQRHLPCPGSWLLSQIGPAGTHGEAILFEGICATPSEVQAAKRDRENHTI